MIDAKLEHPNDDERHHREEQPDPNLADRGQREGAADGGIKEVVEERDHREDEEAVHDVDLLGQKIEPEEMQVHSLALDRPLAAAALVPERPENHGEREDDPDAKEDAAAFLARQVAEESETGWRDVHHFVAAKPKNHRRDEHQNAGQSKCPARSPVWIAEQNRAEPDGKRRAEVDGKIEPAEDAFEQVPVRFAELVADVRGDARL